MWQRVCGGGHAWHGCVWQGKCMAGQGAWQGHVSHGVCMAGGFMCGGGGGVHAPHAP